MSFAFWLSMVSSLEKSRKKTKVKLDLFTNTDMLIMVEKGIRGGICHFIYRFPKVTNK